jgi:hypothetical protein
VCVYYLFFCLWRKGRGIFWYRTLNTGLF